MTCGLVVDAAAISARAGPLHPNDTRLIIFRKGNGALPRSRIVMDRKGRGGRAREAGQMEMLV